jgi:predicted aminopeptidase
MFLLMLMLACFIWHDLIIYGLEQGYGQLKMVRDSKPVAEIINNPATPDSTRQKLLLIQEIRQFAFDSLGINYSDNYTEYYDMSGQGKLLTVSACEPYELRAKEWTFPVLGTVSYKGYFNIKKAMAEINELRMQGYDVDVYSPSGWSTLGWFKDPILSSMLKKREGELADLIIHELTHGTLFVKNSVTFNENLASFIGDKGAQKFLLNKYGIDSDEYREYIEDKADENTFTEYMLACIPRLDSLYSTFKKEDSEQSRKAKKRALITDIVLGVSRLQLNRPRAYFKYSLQAFREGNAFFMTFSRYDSQYELFEKEYKEKYRSDLKLYMEALKEKYPSL